MKISTIFGLGGICIFLLFACASPETPVESVAQVVATPISPIITPIGTIVATSVPPTPESTVTPDSTATPVYQLPPCQFNSGENETLVEIESEIKNYAFSDPQPVLNYEIGIDIINWLPDNKRLLFTRSLPDQPLQSIEVFDVERNEIERFGEGRPIGVLNGSNEPVWLASREAVAFVDVDPNGRYILRIVGKDEISNEEVVANLASPYIGIVPNTSRVTLFKKENRTYPQIFNSDTMQLEDIDISGPNVDEKDMLSGFLGDYQLAWHPAENEFVYFNNHNFYLANTRSKETCTIDWGKDQEGQRWALSAHWSPDGNYLAAFTTVGRLPVPFIELVILNMTTGSQKVIEIPETSNKYAIAWAPNSRDALVIAQSPTNENGHNIYIVDTFTSQNNQIFQESEFLFSGNTGVAWSSDAKRIALNCFKQEPSQERHVCLVEVEVK